MRLGLTLPWPAQPAWPNRRRSWQATQRARNDQRDDACREVLCLLDYDDYRQAFAGQGKLPTKVLFCPPTKGRFDLDNALSACKGYLDGVALALEVDDSRFRPLTVDQGPVEKHGAVYIQVTEED